MFRNRTEAGKKLAARLKTLKDRPEIIMTLPGDGVPIAYEVARELNIPLEIILVKKLCHPNNKEYAIGAVGLDDHFVIHKRDVPEQYIESEIQRLQKELMDMKSRFIKDKQPANLKGKTLVVIDYGISTGNTSISVLRILRKCQPGKIIIAVPVITESAYNKLVKEADEIIAISVPETFYGVGAFYEDFTRITDREVISYLGRLEQHNNIR